MKIEKLNENKIRVLLKNEDIKDRNIDLHSIMTKALEPQGIFLEMLNQAEKEVGFYTDGYKLLIEAYSSPDNDFVFTITKYLEETKQVSSVSKKKATPRIMPFSASPKLTMFSFLDFEDFCRLCSCLNSSNISSKGLAKLISLYEFENIYYLVVKDLNTSKYKFRTILSVFSEFGKIVNASPSFENKLIEYGKVVIKHNALLTGVKYFT